VFFRFPFQSLGSQALVQLLPPIRDFLGGAPKRRPGPKAGIQPVLDVPSVRRIMLDIVESTWVYLRLCRLLLWKTTYVSSSPGHSPGLQAT
jgi:hypothetical protein